MALQNNDLFIVERGGVQYKMDSSQLTAFIGAPASLTVNDIAERNALTDLNSGDKVFVIDATADATVNSGWAIYRVQSVSPIVFFKIQEQESLDLVIVSGHPSASSSGTVQTNPIVVDETTQKIGFSLDNLLQLP